jgi:enoyl-CoA hydratase
MANTDFENLTYEIRAGAAWITVNRPEKLNALNRDTVQEIVAACDAAVADDAAGAVVITGAGPKAFIAGADIGEMAKLSASEGQSLAHVLQASLDRLERCPKPVIAAINGFALGGGCELAIACHIRFAAEGARFGQPEVNLGLIPGAGGTQRLPKLIGRGRAMEMVLGGGMVDAAEAHRIGLVNRVFPADELVAGVDAFVAQLGTKSPIALSRALEALVSAGEVSHAEAMRMEAGLFGLCFATDDMREGTLAFLEKRKASFSGR